jgi:hypothetical protein
MKTKRLVHSLMWLVPLGLLAGCAGYNTTMFMTKSNAGLDIDMKPPTAEINISRKEAVIEPVFEKGQTPPVMASFKPNVHFGGILGNYFLGVDQTFAGGDAAKTMAQLYDSPTLVLAGDDPIFNSEIILENPITSSSIFTTPAPPGKIRPFIFGTDTSLGLKVAWSGAGGQFPDTVKAGFNRKEFAWAPITMSKNSNSVKMPSFLATIESNIGGKSDTNKPAGTSVPGQSGGIKSIQYFATGDAATRLARQKDVRDAMLKRLDPRYASKGAMPNSVVLRQILFAMSQTFHQLSGRDELAAAYANKLDNLQGIDIPDSLELTKPPMYYYTFNPGVGTNKSTLIKLSTTRIIPVGSPASITANFVNTYLSFLEDSITALESAKRQIAKDEHSVLFAVDKTMPKPLSLTNSFEAQFQLQLQNQRIMETQQAISDNPDIKGALGHFNRLVKQ